MNEQAIFEAALEIENAAKRRAFIEKACAGDPELKAQVEALLRSHESAGSFLEIPAVAAPKADTARPVERTTDFTPKGNSGAENEKEEDREVALSFLQPSTKPDSLGVLGHYEILHILGQGGFGIVFKAFDEKLHRLVAIKVMSPQLAATSPPRKRFQREARAAAAIKHENIVQVYSVEDQPLPYLVMEYIDGQTLAQKLDGNGPLEPVEVLHLARQIASGLAAAHEKGLIHRDIKPGNILLEAGAEQKVKITDFGLARVTDDASMTRTGTIAGTPMYMAPEQAIGKDLDHRTDLFSFGSVMYQMASGRPPFRASTTIAVLRRVVEDTPRPLREILPEIPTWLAVIVNKLLEKNPDERFQSAKEVADLLERCQSELQLNGKVTCVPEETSSPQSVATVPVEVKPKGQESRVRAIPKYFIGIGLATFAICATVVVLVVSQFYGDGQGTIQTISPKAAFPTSSKLDQSVSPDADRVLAEWVISIGGSVQVDNQVNEIVLSSDLPKKTFYVSGVNLDANSLITDFDSAMFANAKRLRRLYLANTRLTDDSAPHLAQCENIEELFVHGTRISRKTFAVCKNLKKLRTFFASGSVDTAVSQLGDCSELDYLSLSISDLSDDGLAHLRNLKKLKTLEVKITRITDAGLENLKELRNLTFLDLKETAVTQRAVNTLHERLPQCKIEWNGGVIDPSASAAAERKAAEYVLNLGGEVVLDLANGSQSAALHAIAELPAEPFHVHLINLQQPKHQLRDEDLKHFEDLSKLQVLRIPSATEITDTGLQNLQKLTNLKILVVSVDHVSAEGFGRLSQLSALEDIGLTGAVTDEMLSQMRLNWPKLKFLTIDLGQAKITAAGFDELSRFESLDQLNLSNWSTGDFRLIPSDFLGRLSSAQKLRSLGLSHLTIDDAGMQRIGEMSKLTFLVLGPCRLPDASVAHLRGLKALGRLDLYNTKITDAAMKDIGALTTLGHLDLQDTAIGDVGLEQLQGLTHLRHLNVKGAKATGLGVKKLAAALPQCGIVWDSGVIEGTVSVNPDRRAAEYVLSKSGSAICINGLDQTRRLGTVAQLPIEDFTLTFVEMAWNREVNDAGMANFKGCKDLLELNLAENAVTDEGLANFKDCNKLQVLNLARIQARDGGLAHFKECKELKQIHLLDMPITDVGLAHLSGCKDLTDLSLRALQITDAALANFKDCPNLVKIRLEGVPLSDLGFANFKDCKKLKDVDLDGTSLSDVGLEIFAALPNLSSLRITRTKVTEAAIRKLEAALPKCKIESDFPEASPRASSLDRSKPATNELDDKFTNSLGIEFALIPKGKAWLGGEGGKSGDIEIEMKEDFYLGIYPVTQKEWSRVMKANPSSFSRTGAGKQRVAEFSDADLELLPVEMVTFEDCQKFVTQLNEKVKEKGWIYRLPTESEWEYACRGGPSTVRLDSGFDYYFERARNQLRPEDANFGHGVHGQTCRVGSYKPNRLGLHDLHGNVHQWCEYDTVAKIRPEEVTRRALRGGSFYSPAYYCRAANRFLEPMDLSQNNIGLRVARVRDTGLSPKK